jgi:2-phospho-L-lactate guanylyltransferase
VQATVHTFDPRTGSGSVLTDDGVRLAFAPPAFEDSGLRLLRPGQRLTVDVRDDEVVGLRLLGI